MSSNSKDESDWIRLAVKYKGKCATCGKDVAAGETALWSKKAKTIKHIECSLANGNLEAKGSELELACAVCGRKAGCPECSLAADCDRPNVSPLCICPSCLEKETAYFDYQGAFREMLSRLPKVKI